MAGTARKRSGGLPGMKGPRVWLAALLFSLVTLLAGCEDVDLLLATEAGVDAVKAATLSEEAVLQLSAQAAAFADGKHPIAPGNSDQARRLARLTVGLLEQDGQTFDCKVYLIPEVNAFAMADGTIRIYSGLMELMSDDELLFVLGHEMGHVVKEHVRQKLRFAYAGRALRKGVASLQNGAGALAGSALGGFLERLLNAQFSQQEEREADDYGLAFLQRSGREPGAAVSALRKLAGLGSGHSFLSSHPAPAERAARLAARLQ